MKKIFEIFGQQPLLDRDVGIEIECEGDGLLEVNNALWKTVDDGSLRGVYPYERAEFVLKKPIPIKNVNAALTQLIKAQANAKFNFSFRTSVHVHVNIQMLTEPQLVNMIYTYMLLEEAMMNYCGRDRKGNRFCLRLADAEGILDAVSYVILNGVKEFMYNFNEDTIRYSGINLAAIFKYGSLEFRGMRGNLDLNVLNTWCNALVNIRNFAMSLEKPRDVYDAFIDGTPTEFLRTVLKEEADAFIYPKIDKELQKSFSLSIDIPHTYSLRVNNEIEEQPVKPKKILINPIAAEIAANRIRRDVPAPAPIIDDLEEVDRIFHQLNRAQIIKEDF